VLAAKEKNPSPRGRGMRTSEGSRSFRKVPGEEEDERIWGKVDPRIPASRVVVVEGGNSR
jgi:hypothetical protein